MRFTQRCGRTYGAARAPNALAGLLRPLRASPASAALKAWARGGLSKAQHVALAPRLV